MLDLYKYIDLPSLKTELKKMKKGTNKEPNFNFIFVEYKTSGIKIHDLFENCIENKEFNLSVFFENLNKFSFLNTLKKEIKGMLGSNELDCYNTETFLEEFTPGSILNVGMTRGLIQGNNSIGGATPMGPNFWLLPCGYFAKQKDKKMNFVGKFIDFFPTTFNCDNETLSKKGASLKVINKIELNKKIYFNDDTLQQFIEKINSIKDNEELNKLDVLIKEKNILFISDYFGLLNKFSITDFQKNLVTYDKECVKTSVVSVDNNVCCKLCGTKDKLFIDETFVSNQNTNTHVFNLSQSTQKVGDDYKYENHAFYFCEPCSSKTQDIIEALMVNSQLYISFDVDKLSKNVQFLKQLSDFDTNSYLSCVKSIVFKVHQDGLNKTSLQFKQIFSIKNLDKKSAFQRKEYVQKLFNIPMNKSIYWWVDMIQNELNKKTNEYELKKTMLLKNKKSELYDYWLNNKQITKSLFAALVSFYIQNRYKFKEGFISKNNFEAFPFIFNSLLKIDENYNTLYDTLTKKEGEENMFEKHKSLNEKLKEFEKYNELDTIQVNIDQNEFWLLVGVIIKYLNNKSKKSDKTMDMVSSINTINHSSMVAYLNRLLRLYGHEISMKQSKFKAIFSFVIESLMNKTYEKTSETQTYVLSGILNNIVQLTKTNEGVDNE